MFGQISGYQVKPDKWVEFDEAFQAKILPTLRKQHGFIEEIRMASDTMGNRNVASKNAMESITIWATEHDLREYEKNFGNDVRNTLSPFLLSEPRTVDYSTVERSSSEGLAAAGAA